MTPKRLLTVILILTLGLGATPTDKARTAVATAYTVNSTNDVNDGVCNIAHCSLREALIAANTNPGADTIAFNISGAGVHTIAPLTALPAITDDGTTINGYTQPGAAPTINETPATILIEIDGTNTTNQSGLIITSTNNVIRGLTINRFDLDGIGIGFATASGNVVAGNHLGIDPNGIIDRGNGHSGVFVGWGATNNTVGGDEPAERNVLSGNGWAGVEIHGSGTMSNTISGNYIGTAASGMAALGNTLYGVRIYGGAQNNTIGGDLGTATTLDKRNVISGNGNHGVHLAGEGTSGNVVSGNHIGTTVYGIAPIGNAEDGVYITLGAHNNTIGGASEEARNIISGNLHNGVYITGTATMSNTISGNYIGTDATGTARLSNGEYGVYARGGTHANLIGGSTAGERNIISGNGGDGIVLFDSGTMSNTIVGNYIGTNVSGTAALSNTGGIFLLGAAHNIIGGTQPGQGNLVSGNSGPGIFLIDPTTTGNVIAGNLIGTTAGGAAGLGNTEDGIDIWQGAHDNTVGPDNVISGNRRNGILLGVDVSGTAIFGNLIGTNAAGTAALGNGEEGILLDWAPDNLIGGEAPGERNIIAGNASNGVLISGAVANDNVVAGNFIGTDIAGAANLGNGSNGVVLENGAQNNLIGGDTVSERNIISGNEEHGICIKDAGTTDNVVWHNFIGTDSTGTATLGNTACGVYLDSGASESVVRLNLISANLVGVCISGTATMSNTVFGNRIGTDVTGNSPLGNTLAGVYLTGGTHQNTVGGTYPEWNVISGNGGSGVIISGTGTVHNTIWGNMIGAAADSFMLMGNAENGVLIAAGAQHNTIGSENIIVGSPLDGVAVEGDDAYGNRITQNHILSNTLGIHLLGGANGGIATPVITAVTTGSDPVTIQGTACAGCTVEVFGNVNDDGEGHIYLGSTVATGGNFSLTEDTHGLHYLTATATDAALGTSEFSSVYKIPYRVYLPLIVR